MTYEDLVKAGEIVPTDNLNLRAIEKRAVEIILRRRKDQPKKTSNGAMKAEVWGTELNLEISNQMVIDVRADLEANFGGCSVCYATVGHDDWRGHESGDECPIIPLEDQMTEGWLDFKANMKLPRGVMCWNCLLPTVRWTSFSHRRHSLMPKNIEQAKECDRCRLPPRE